MEMITLKAADFDVFYRLREQMLEAIGETNPPAGAAELEQATKAYYQANVGRDLMVWCVSVDGEPVSIACMCVFHRVPYAGNLCGKEGHVLNVYTVPAFRKQGMAKKLMQTIIAHAKENDIGRLWLKASAEARSIYKACGFVEKDNEMDFHCR